ncbi:hypothetical protein VTI74DRAFT_8710 [Chaetomium olivicolor]
MAESAGGNDAANGSGGDLDKPYAEMTKSEKMSWSMRRRWASGEMQGAVEKRRTTLAIKKAERAASTGTNGMGVIAEGAESNGPGMTIEASSAGPSDPTTPASMHAQVPPGPAPPAAFDAPPPQAPSLGPVVGPATVVGSTPGPVYGGHPHPHGPPGPLAFPRGPPPMHRGPIQPRTGWMTHSDWPDPRYDHSGWGNGHGPSGPPGPYG